MTRAEEYRELARRMHAEAAQCPDPRAASEYRKLAMGWVMLASQAEAVDEASKPPGPEDQS